MRSLVDRVGPHWVFFLSKELPGQCLFPWQRGSSRNIPVVRTLGRVFFPSLPLSSFFFFIEFYICRFLRLTRHRDIDNYYEWRYPKILEDWSFFPRRGRNELDSSLNENIEGFNDSYFSIFFLFFSGKGIWRDPASRIRDNLLSDSSSSEGHVPALKAARSH